MRSRVARWRGAAVTLAASLGVFACSKSYEDESPAPVADAGHDQSSPGSDAGPDPAPRIDAGQDATPSDDDASDNPCKPGFQPGLVGQGCVVSNPFKNPGFTSTSEWSTNNSTIIPTHPGVDDPGVARLEGDTDHTGRVSQKVKFESSLLDLPLALVVGGEAENSGITGLDGFGVYSDGLPLGDWRRSKRIAGLEKFRWQWCAGEAVLGGTHEISIRALEDEYDRIDIDHVGLVTDTSCPARATVPNGNFDTDDGWFLVSPSDATAIASPFGVGGGRGLHFGPFNTYSIGRALQPVSVPSTTMTSPALQFRTAGVSGKNNVFHISLDDHLFVRHVAPDAPDTLKFCLPEWSRGVVLSLEFGSGGNGTLHDPQEFDHDFWIDDVQFVNDPTCSSKGGVVNGDFEDVGPNIDRWYANAGKGYAFTHGTSSPHGGSRYLALSSTPEACVNPYGSPAQARQTVRIPEHDRSVTGPRRTFWYRYTADATSAISSSWHLGNLAPTPTWTQVSDCLYDPPGTREEIAFTLSTNTGCTTSSFEIDDVVVDLDPSCKY